MTLVSFPHQLWGPDSEVTLWSPGLFHLDYNGSYYGHVF